MEYVQDDEVNSVDNDATTPTTVTRWEKAVVALYDIVAQVSKFDTEGVDIVCFGGNENSERYCNVIDTEGLEALTNTQPRGNCNMGAAMNEVFKNAFEKDLTKTRPCSILVLTAGSPTDFDIFEESLIDAKQKVEKTAENSTEFPLSVTFIQIGDDPDAYSYLKRLDERKATIITESSRKSMDIIVDVIKNDDIQAAMKGFVNTTCATKKRTTTKRWNGEWKCTHNDDENVTTLKVTDNGKGKITIEGFPTGNTIVGTYIDCETGGDLETNNNCILTFTHPSGELLIGTVEDEGIIVNWSNGTKWEAITTTPNINSDNDVNWAAYIRTWTTGVAEVGITDDYLTGPQFFNNISKQEKRNYIIVVDRSAKMSLVDERNDTVGLGNLLS